MSARFQTNLSWHLLKKVKFIYSEKATKFCEIFPLLLTLCTVVKSKRKISQNFVAFSEYMNFTMAAAVHSIFGRKLDALGSLGSYRPCVGYFLQMCTKKGIRLALELLIKQENGRAPFSNPYKIYYYTKSQATARP